MNKTMIPALCFSLEWMAYYLIVVIGGKIRGWGLALFLIPALLLLVFAVAISKAAPGYRGRNRLVPVIAVALIALDQAIKLVVSAALPAETAVAIIPGYYYLGWVKNEFGSWVTSMLGIRAPLPILSALNAAVLIYAAAYYRYYAKKFGRDLWTDFAAVLMGAGCACSLIDKLAWGGSVDYIGLNGLFVTDLKDIFLSLSIGFIFTESFVNKTRNETARDKPPRGVWESLKEDAKAILKRKSD
jgi:signal peptidase II